MSRDLRSANRRWRVHSGRAVAGPDPDEFYCGIFAQPWTGGRGVAYRPGGWR